MFYFNSIRFKCFFFCFFFLANEERHSLACNYTRQLNCKIPCKTWGFTTVSVNSKITTQQLAVFDCNNDSDKTYYDSDVYSHFCAEFNKCLRLYLLQNVEYDMMQVTFCNNTIYSPYFFLVYTFSLKLHFLERSFSFFASFLLISNNFP